jgi:inner membrane protein
MKEFLLQSIGWVATLIFACSYFFRKPSSLRVVQAIAALLWIAYGIIIEAPPVIVANVVVAAMALVSVLASRRRESTPATD